MSSTFITSKLVVMVILLSMVGSYFYFNSQREILSSSSFSPRRRAVTLRDESLPPDDYVCAPSVYKHHHDQCSSARKCEPGGMLNYLEWYYCGDPGIRWLKLLLFILFLLLLFYLLGTVANDFFSPALQDISFGMGLSPDLAGVTLLAFGNGAPDIFSCFAALRDGQAEIAVGGIVGGALFVIYIVVGAISFSTVCKVQPFAFARDILCSLLSTVLLCLVVVFGAFRVWEMVVFVLLYSLYVILSLYRNYRIKANALRSQKFFEELPHAFPTRKDMQELEADYLMDSKHHSQISYVRMTFRPPSIQFPENQNPLVDLVIEDETKMMNQNDQSTYPSNNQQSNITQSNISQSNISQSMNQQSNISQSMNQQSNISQSHNSSNSLSNNTSSIIHNNPTSIDDEDDFISPQSSRSTSPSIDETQPLLSLKPSYPSTGVDIINMLSGDDELCCDLAANPHAESNLDFLNEPFIEPRPHTFTPKTPEEQLLLSQEESVESITIPTAFQKLKEHWRKEIGWGGKSRLERVSFVLLSPFTFILSLTIPHVDVESWDKCLAVLNPLFAPFVLALVTNGYSTYLGGVFPLWLLFFFIGVPLAVVVFRFTKLTQRPHRMFFFLLAAFFMSIIWIYLIATELVSLLQVIGVIADLSPSVLGLTVLAWGNSTSDLISNLAVARQGFPEMAIAAAFGNPMFNILIGFGIPMLIYASIIFPSPYFITMNPSLVISLSFVALGLLSSLFTVPSSNYTIPKKYGIWLIVVYLLQIALSVLVEIGLIAF